MWVMEQGGKAITMIDSAYLERKMRRYHIHGRLNGVPFDLGAYDTEVMAKSVLHEMFYHTSKSNMFVMP